LNEESHVDKRRHVPCQESADTGYCSLDVIDKEDFETLTYADMSAETALKVSDEEKREVSATVEDCEEGDDVVQSLDDMDENKDTKGDDRLASDSLFSPIQMREGTTDLEDFVDSDGSAENNDHSYDEQSLTLIEALMWTGDATDISEKVKRSLSGTPSPAVTPSGTPEPPRQKHHGSKKLHKKRLLSPGPSSRHASRKGDESDVSNSEDEGQRHLSGKQKQKRRSRSPRIKRENALLGATDVEDVDLSATEEAREDREIDVIPDTSSKVYISVTPAEGSAPILSGDTDVEDINLSDIEDATATDKLRYLHLSPKVGGASALTDVEDLEIDPDAKVPLDEVADCCGSVSEKHSLRIVGSQSSQSTATGESSDSEDSPSDLPVVIKKITVPKITLQRADEDSSDVGLDVDSESDSYEVGGHSRSESKVSDASGRSLYAQSSPAPLTDVENFDDEDYTRPKTPEPESEDCEDCIPEPHRQLTLVSEGENGCPEEVVLPLGDAEPLGLSVPDDEMGGAVTDIEEVDDSGEEENIPYPHTPDIPEFEGSVVESSDVVKLQKKRLKVGETLIEPTTDTETVYIPGKGSKKRKSKSKNVKKPKSTIEVSSLGVSDVEDIVVSDFENTDPHGFSVSEVPMPSQILLTVESGQLGDKTDVEEITDEGEEGVERRKSLERAVTPECLHELEINFVTTVEGDGPFSAEARNEISERANLMKSRFSIDKETSGIEVFDTEEDETAVSASEEDSRGHRLSFGDIQLPDGEQSVVYVTNAQTFDPDFTEEALHIKGPVLQEGVTDVEDINFSEEEAISVASRMAVLDQETELCVCMASRDPPELATSVCVCLGKEDHDLSMKFGANGTTEGTASSAPLF